MQIPAKASIGSPSSHFTKNSNVGLSLGQRVRVKCGALLGIDGEVASRQSDNRLLVAMQFQQQTVWISIQDVQVEPV